MRLSACTAVIESGAAAGDELAQALHKRCWLYEEQSKRDAALEDCSRAIELKPDYRDVYYSRATIHLNRGDYDQAIADYDRTIAWDQDAVGALTLRGMAYAKKGDYDRAVADFTRALKLRPDFGMAEAQEAKARAAGGQSLGDPHAWCEGKALPQEGFAEELQIKGCTQLIRSGKEKHRDLARYYFNRARAYNFQGDRSHAIADYAQAIRLNPINAEAFGSRGMINWVESDYTRAVADLSQALRLKPGSVLYLMYRGQSYAAMGRFAAAIADYDRVLKLAPANAEAFLNRSIALTGKGDYARAIADADQAIKLSRTSEATEGYNSRGNAHFHLGDWPAAIDDYHQALQKWSEYPKALYGRGAARIRNGDVTLGAADIAAAVKLQSDIAAIEAKAGIKP